MGEEQVTLGAKESQEREDFKNCIDKEVEAKITVVRPTVVKVNSNGQADFSRLKRKASLSCKEPDDNNTVEVIINNKITKVSDNHPKDINGKPKFICNSNIGSTKIVVKEEKVGSGDYPCMFCGSTDVLFRVKTSKGTICHRCIALAAINVLNK